MSVLLIVLLIAALIGAAVAGPEAYAHYAQRRTSRANEAEAHAAEQKRNDSYAADAARQHNQEQAPHTVEIMTQRFQPVLSALRAHSRELRTEAAAADARAKRFEGAAESAQASVPAWWENSPALRAAVLAAAVALIPATAAELALDYLIFRARFTPLTAALMTPVTVVSICSFGILLTAGLGLHTGGGSDALRGYHRRLVVSVGVAGLVGILAWLVSIAPFRTAGAQDAKVQAAQTAKNIQESKRAAGVGSTSLLQAARVDVANAQQARREAARLDQIAVIVVSAGELLLVEAALFAAPLASARRAKAVAEAAQRSARGLQLQAVKAEQHVHAAISRFGGDINELLFDHGVQDPHQVMQTGLAFGRRVDEATHAVLGVDATNEPSPPVPAAGGATPAQSRHSAASDDLQGSETVDRVATPPETRAGGAAGAPTAVEPEPKAPVGSDHLEVILPLMDLDVAR